MKPPRVRPRALRPPRFPRPQRGIPLRAILPNAVTALALCSGLSGIRFAMDGKWEIAVLMVLLAAVLDGIDGRIARMVHGESRFGAELDSLSDAISFGVAPALILFMWTLNAVPRVGWLVALVYALFCALRLARFNAQIDHIDQPHKSAGFLTGVPAPAGAIIAMVPLYLWLSTDQAVFRSPWLVAPWLAFAALLMVSSLATWSGSALKLRRRIRFEAIRRDFGALALAHCRRADLPRDDSLLDPRVSPGQAAARSRGGTVIRIGTCRPRSVTRGAGGSSAPPTGPYCSRNAIRPIRGRTLSTIDQSDTAITAMKNRVPRIATIIILHPATPDVPASAS